MQPPIEIEKKLPLVLPQEICQIGECSAPAHAVISSFIELEPGKGPQCVEFGICKDHVELFNAGKLTNVSIRKLWLAGVEEAS